MGTELGQSMLGETTLNGRNRLRMKIIKTCKFKDHDLPTHHCVTKHGVPLDTGILVSPDY